MKGSARDRRLREIVRRRSFEVGGGGLERRPPPVNQGTLERYGAETVAPSPAAEIVNVPLTLVP